MILGGMVRFLDIMRHPFFIGGPEFLRGAVARSRKIHRNRVVLGVNVAAGRLADEPTDFRGRYLRNAI